MNSVAGGMLSGLKIPGMKLNTLPTSLTNLIDELSLLPGVGKKQLRGWHSIY